MRWWYHPYSLINFRLALCISWFMFVRSLQQHTRWRAGELSNACGVNVQFHRKRLSLPTSSWMSNSKRSSSSSSSIIYHNEDEFNRRLGEEKVLYMDDDIVVVEKPENVQTTAGLFHKESIVHNMARIINHPSPDQMVVHRLDYATSGLVVLARHVYALKQLHNQFRQSGQVKKIYMAVVAGIPSTTNISLSSQTQNEGIIDLPLIKDIEKGAPYYKIATPQDERTEQATILIQNPKLKTKAKSSVTHWKVLGSSSLSSEETISLMQLEPKTGRTHQLRLHMTSLGTPILGDTLYANDRIIQMSSRLLLHAHRLEFNHPRLVNKRMSFCSPCPFSLDKF